MPTGWLRHGIGGVRMAGLSAALLLGGAPALALAQAPAKWDCSSGATVYDRLACKQQALIAQQEALVSGFEGTVVQQVLERRGLEKTHDRLVGEMRSRHARAKKADARAEPRHFKDAVKKQKRTVPASDCALRPLEDASGEQVGDLNGNGICDAGEDCASAGDFTRRCNPNAKPGHKLACAKICPEAGEALPEPLPPADEEEDEIAEGLLQSYDEMEDTLIEMNEAMAALPPAAAVRTAFAASADPCADVAEPPAALETTAKVLKIADVALEGAAKIADKLCGQTVVAVAVAAGFGGGGGGNTSAVCTVIETASAIASGASTVVEIALEFLRDDVQAATFACLQHTIAQVGQVQATVEASGAALLQQIEETQAAIEARVSAAESRLRSDVAEARAEWRAQYFDLVLLLSTPQGQRPGFPADASGGK